MSTPDPLFLRFSALENLLGRFPDPEVAPHRATQAVHIPSPPTPVAESRKAPRPDVKELLRHIRLKPDSGPPKTARTDSGETSDPPYIPKDRSVQTDLFFDRTQNIATYFEPQTAGNFLAASQSIAHLFESDPSLDPPFLEQFVRQSKTLSLKDQDTFNGYLLLIDQLANASSSATLESFLAVVQDLLDHIEGNLKSLFDHLRKDLDLRPSMLKSAEQKLHTGELRDFLQTIEDFLNQVE